MANDHKQLRKAYPKDQLLMDGVFDDETLRKIHEAQSGDHFEAVDLDIETEYCCPSCGYEWSGNPKPGRS
jgi:rubrerythrin